MARKKLQLGDAMVETTFSKDTKEIAEKTIKEIKEKEKVKEKEIQENKKEVKSKLSDVIKTLLFQLFKTAFISGVFCIFYNNFVAEVIKLPQVSFIFVFSVLISFGYIISFVVQKLKAPYIDILKNLKNKNDL